MIKNHKLSFILSTIITLLPAAFAPFADKVFKEEIAIHWGLEGTADGFAPASAFFLIMPFVLLAFHFLNTGSCFMPSCILFSWKSPRAKNMPGACISSRANGIQLSFWLQLRFKWRRNDVQPNAPAILHARELRIRQHMMMF